jgi:hypothetical protein
MLVLQKSAGLGLGHAFNDSHVMYVFVVDRDLDI